MKRTNCLMNETYTLFSHGALKWGCKHFPMTGCRIKCKCTDLHRDIKKCTKNHRHEWTLFSSKYKFVNGQTFVNLKVAKYKYVELHVTHISS